MNPDVFLNSKMPEKMFYGSTIYIVRLEICQFYLPIFCFKMQSLEDFVTFISCKIRNFATFHLPNQVHTTIDDAADKDLSTF